MSTLYTELVEIASITQHPNADRLEIAKIKGTTVVVQKGTFHPGERAIYFPPDILIPSDVAERLGVSKYLKHARFSPDADPTPCRVGACRLRGQPSYGFLAPLNQLPVGANLDSVFGTAKYTPPVRQFVGDTAPDHPAFHEYTHIEHYWRFPDAIPVGTPVRITEKIHGTNSRVGIVDTVWMTGSHRARRKTPEGVFSFSDSFYWHPFTVSGVQDLIAQLAQGGKPVILFGEIFGSDVQDMDYGVAGATGYRVFDISVGGQYLDWQCVKLLCQSYDVPPVPTLYCGPFSPDLIETFTHGPTTLALDDQIKSRFKGREGIVITPLTETHSDVLGGRLILKSVSADYLDRKGAQDNE